MKIVSPLGAGYWSPETGLSTIVEKVGGLWSIRDSAGCTVTFSLGEATSLRHALSVDPELEPKHGLEWD